jgi:CO/xanthine dehydrogenase Mo-binding subunit
VLIGVLMLGIPERKLRVVAPDVGGGFGSKQVVYAEEALVTWAARKLRRPVKWVADRSEAFLSDAQGRDHPASGQLLTGSFMDYRMPRADDLPPIAVATQSTPCRHNPLGVKGCGEVGTIASPATVMSAVVDALTPYGITHLDMPATPQRIWHAIRSAHQPAAA